MLQRQQQGRHVAVAALMVAMCIALPAILAPAPPLAAAADVSAGGITLGTTSAIDDAVGGAAATLVPAPSPPPAAGDGEDVFLDTIRDLCRNLSNENINKKCGTGAPACAELRARINAALSNVTNTRVDTLAIAREMLAPASQARTAGCFFAVQSRAGSKSTRNCRKALGDLRKEKVVSEKQRNLRNGFRAQKAPLALLRVCDKNYEVIKPCHYDEIDAEKCLGRFRQGKTTLEKSYESKDKVDVSVLGDPRSYTETVTRTNALTFECCDLHDRCLCHLKKKLGNDTVSRIPCLEKEELQVCK